MTKPSSSVATNTSSSKTRGCRKKVIIAILALGVVIGLAIVGLQRLAPKASNFPDVIAFTSSNGLAGIQAACASSSAYTEPKRPVAVFIHGTPGDTAVWFDTFAETRLQDVQLIAIDRPGFGLSTTSWQTALPLRQQAEMIRAAIAEQIGKRSYTAVGHSLGGPIALWLLALDPNAKSAVLAAASLAPELEQPRWFNHLLDTWLAKQVVPDNLLLSNDEIMRHAEDLQALQPRLANINKPVILLQGRKDGLVNLKTVDYFIEQYPAEWLTLKWLDLGHLLPWQASKDIAQAVIDLNEMAN